MGIDAGSDAGVDAGRPDAGLPDAGPPDSGLPDSGVPDAGPPDSGVPDAGPPDSGVPDAGPPDSGVPDAGLPDSGMRDAGSADAGSDAGVPDAGPPDAGPPDAGCGCGSRRCLNDGGCGDCLGPSDCASSALPQCDLATNTCVGCLALPADTCARGTYCSSFTCIAGCSADSACGSGQCLSTHDCARCQSDSECADGRRCGSGICSPPCTDGGTCPTGFDCCAQRCVDTRVDPDHCGVCNGPCTLDEFCGLGTCTPVLLANTCVEPVARTVLDDTESDDDAGTSMAQALADACVPAPQLATVHQTDGGILDVTTGEPLLLGELLITGGGNYYQRIVSWLETSGAAHVNDTSTSSQYQYTLRDGGVLTQGLVSDIGPHHDVFVVQLSRSPGSGAPVLSASGFYAPGTVAAAWYFINVLLPMRASLTSSWFVVEWTDTDLDGLPGPADSWVPIGSGQ
jgi:hypothetical protein